MTYKIIDNFLDNDVFNKIKSEMTGSFFPWYYNDFKSYKDEDKSLQENPIPTLYNYQFTHKFYEKNSPQSSFWDLMEPVVEKIGATSLIRIKANLGPVTPNRIAFGLHKDFNDLKNTTAKTSILYINTNNGATRFEDGSEVKSIENRFVSFNNNTLHTGVSCTDAKSRILINFCYYDE